MRKALDLISFYKDIEIIVKNKEIDARLFILYVHLYLEHYITFISEKKRIVECNLNSRSKKLLRDKVITVKAYNLISLIIKLRNKLVHSLTITIDDVNKELDKMEELFKTDDKELLKAIESSDRWQRLHIYSVTLITVLYKITCDLYNIKPKYDIRPEVILYKDKNPTWRMVLLKNPN